MTKLLMKIGKTILRILLSFILLSTGMTIYQGAFQPAKAQTLQQAIYLPFLLDGKELPPITMRTVNAAYFTDNTFSFHRSTVFWFGRLSISENYADVRVGYTDSTLSISLNIMDRSLWYDYEPDKNQLTDWDAATLYISSIDNPGSMPGNTETRWVAQLSHWQPREDYQAVYQGNGSGWVSTNLPFTTESSYRGQGLNDNDAKDKGWTIVFHIPFSSLGFVAPPHGRNLRLGIALHDRDASTGSTLADKVWPENLNTLSPTSWGGLHLGDLMFTPPMDEPDGTTLIRSGYQGVTVKDAHVGGAFDCGTSVDYSFELWGNANYESIDPTQINIQNQRDISDWPCFSKYFITFPLSQLPANAKIISASLTMYHFGNSLPEEANSSNIHLLTVNEDWEDTTITWNNAPLAWTNYTRLRVEPLLTYPGWPGVPVTWDVSLAVQHALEQGVPLRLALYSSDDPMHSGKYFRTSESEESNATSPRPYLLINWAYP